MRDSGFAYCRRITLLLRKCRSVEQHGKSSKKRCLKGETNLSAFHAEKNADCKRTVKCYNCPIMSSHVAFTINEAMREQIDHLARMTGKPQEAVLREVVETGLKSYKTIPSKSARAVLDLIAWAEKEHLTGQAKDVSTNHNTYAWEE